jgi:hypothetical protein
MIGGVQLSDIQHVAKNGSPAILHVVGRAVGLGQEERAALSNGGLPWWLVLGGGIAIGFVLGARTHKAYPNHMPKWVSGGSR